MTLLWAIVSLLLLVSLVLIMGVLVYGMFGPMRALRKARSEARRYRSVRQRALHDLDYAHVKRLLLNHEYFSGSLRATPTLQEFFSRLEKKEEVWLASRYPRKKLCRLLVKAEREAAMSGPSVAPEYVDEIFELLLELARKSKEAAG